MSNMSKRRLFASIAAFGTLIAGIVAFFAVLRDVVLWLWPMIAVEDASGIVLVKLGVAMLGLAIFGVLAIAIAGPVERAIKRWMDGEIDLLRFARRSLIGIGLVGVAFSTVGFAGGADKALAAIRGVFADGSSAPAKRAPRAVPTIDGVCAAARKNRPDADGGARHEVAGIWEGSADWLGDGQSWTLAADGSLQLTGGYPGRWRYSGGKLTISFGRGTVFEARIDRDMMCGIRLRPDGDRLADGSFVLFRTSGQPSAEMPAAPPEESWIDSPDNLM